MKRLTGNLLPVIVFSSAAWALACSGGGATPDARAPAADAPLARDAAAAADAQAADGATASGDILEDLRAIPGMEVTERTTFLSGYRWFSLTYQQPVDHRDPTGPTFKQRIMLLHKSYDAITVLATNGYYVATNDGRFEPTVITAGNQVSVEHRYFPPSSPVPADWSKLDIWQAASDHHRIVQALKKLYRGKWLNTGASKSGMAAVYHRRFYPDDVDGTIAYVAPLSFGAPDSRYVDFVEQAGPSESCRQKLRDFQRLALSKREAMKQRMPGTGATFEILGIDEALEHAVIELPFALWQYSDASACDRVPAAGATDSAIFSFLDQISDISAYGDQDIVAYGAYYYQAAQQLGFPEINEAWVSDLLLHPGTDVAGSYMPAGTTPSYDPEVMQDIDRWVRTEGRALLFIYGEYDPWSAGAFELGGAVDSLKVVVPAGNHGSTIGKLGEADKARVTALLRGWLGIAKAPLELGRLQPGEQLAVEPRRRL